MNDIRTQPEAQLESGQTRSSTEQALDTATYEPREFVEHSNDYQKAEAIQTALVAVIDSASAARDVGATPLPIPQPEDKSVIGSLPGVRGDLDQVTVGADDGRHDATPIPLPGKEEPAGATPINTPGPKMRIQAEEEEGHPPEPPDLDHNPYSEEMLETSEDNSLHGQMPKVRGDLNQAKSIGGKSEATPINLPGPQAASAAAEFTGDFSSGKVAAEDDWEAPNADRLDGNPEPGFQKGSGGPVEFEKPILYKEMEDLDSGLGKLDDLDALTPGPGKLGGAPGEKAPGRGILGGMPGLEGFKGGPSDLLKNNDGMGSGKGHEIPGWDSPFLPGKGPNQGMETSGGGGKKSGSPGQGKQSGGKGSQSQQGGNVTVVLATVGKDGKVTHHDKETSPSDCETTKGSVMRAGGEKSEMKEEGSADINCGGGNHFFVTWNKNGVTGYKWTDSSNKSSDPDLPHGKDTSQPLAGQMAYDRMNPKFDSGHISNYPEDHIAGGQGGGMLKPEHAEAIKRTLDLKGKLANAKPKAGAEQITDPPSPDPGKKSETTGKDG
jgi:hypothetical protein